MSPKLPPRNRLPTMLADDRCADRRGAPRHRERGSRVSASMIAILLDRTIRTDSRQGALLATLVAAIALLSIFLVDYYFLVARPSLVVIGLLDEIAHAATAAICLLATWRAFSIWFAAGCLGGAVLIDFDHLPAILVSGEGALDAGRPYSHSIATLLILLVLSGLLTRGGRSLALGASFGVATHLVRDMATGGVPLFWPLDNRSVEIYYGLYGGVMVLLAGIVLYRFARSRIDSSLEARSLI
jgi:inner membrane protein